MFLWFWQEALPPAWQWVGFGIGILALFLGGFSVLTFVDMVFRRPNIHATFKTWMYGGYEVFYCIVSSRPNVARPFAALGARREPANLTTNFLVTQTTGSPPGLIAFNLSHCFATNSQEMVDQNGPRAFLLHPGSTVAIPLARISAVPTKGEPAVLPRTGQGPVNLPPGEYKVLVGVATGHSDMSPTFECFLEVDDHLYWRRGK